VLGEPVRPGEYGDRIAAVEPGGVEFIPAGDRHGRPLQLLWTWTSPNLEFATVFLGILAVGVFGLGFWEAVLALLIGNLLGSLSHAVLSARGPKQRRAADGAQSGPVRLLGQRAPGRAELGHRRFRLCSR